MNGTNNFIVVNLASTVNIVGTTNGAVFNAPVGNFNNLVLDGVAIKLGDTVLIKDQTNLMMNGVWVVNKIGDGISVGWKLIREGCPIRNALLTFVKGGDINCGRYYCIDGDGIVCGKDEIPVDVQKIVSTEL